MRPIVKIGVILMLAVALMAVRPVSEADFISELTEKFGNYNRLFPQAKLYLDFDQPSYAPGDTAFFRAYLLNDDLSPSKGRQVVHLVLVDADGHEVLRNSISVDQGIATNQFVIDRKISSGVYLMVAYTNWMRNFSKDLYFTTPFTIGGEFLFAPAPQGSVQVNLFPEGGSLIAGLTSKVTVLGRRETEPTSIAGNIVDDLGSQVQTFTCTQIGLANFEFTPEPGRSYFLNTANGNKKAIVVNEEGWALQANQSKDFINLKIGYRSSKPKAETLSVVLTSQSKVHYASMLRTTQDEPVEVIIPKRTIPEGLAQLFLFNSKGDEVASRVLFVQQHEPMNANLLLKTTRTETRSALSLDMDLKDSFGATRKAEMLVNSFYQSLFPNQSLPDLREQLLIGLDLPDAKPLLNAIDLTTPEGAEAIDDFLITQKWKRFTWEDVFEGKKKVEYPVINSVHFTGQALFKDSGKAVPDSTMILFLLQNEIFGYEVYTRDGRFEWPVFFNFFGDDHIMYSMEYKGKRLTNTTLRLDKDSLIGFRAPASIQTRQKDPYFAFSTLADVVSSSFSYSWRAPELKREIENPNAAFEDELNGADATIRVDEYVVFPTMEDLFREVVKFVQHRKIGGKPTLRVLSSDSNNPITGEPLYVIDGVATRNTDFVLSMKPGDIATIKVINDLKKLRTMGQITKNGVVFFQTKVADMASSIPSEDILILRGLNKPLPFRINELGPAASPRIPNLKSSLYWKEAFERNERGMVSGEFYTSDHTGTLLLRVSGVAEGGIPFDQRYTVEVNFAQARK